MRAHFEPGKTVKFDPDLKAYPREFSLAEPGESQFMARLDQDQTVLTRRISPSRDLSVSDIPISTGILGDLWKSSRSLLSFKL